MKKIAVISFQSGREQETKVLALDIEQGKPSVKIVDTYISQENYYNAVKVGNMEKMSELLQELGKQEKFPGRLYQIILPDDLIQLQCFKISQETVLPLGNKPQEKEALRQFCLKQYPDGEKAKLNSLAILKITKDEHFYYITCAFIMKQILENLQTVFHKQNFAVFSIEPQIFSIGAMAYYKYPQGNVVFKDANTYFLLDKKGILTLNSLGTDDLTSCQLLLALKQKNFEGQEETPELTIIKPEDFCLLPSWFDTGNMLDPMTKLYGLSSTLIRMTAWEGYIGDKWEGGRENANSRLGKLFRRRAKNL